MNTPNVPAYTTNAKTLREFRFHCANVRWRNHLFLGTETDQCQSAELVGDKSTSLLREGHPEQRAETLCPDATKQRNLGPYVGAERGCTLASRTMKQASVSSTDQGGGKRRSGSSTLLLPVDDVDTSFKCSPMRVPLRRCNSSARQARQAYGGPKKSQHSFSYIGTARPR